MGLEDVIKASVDTAGISESANESVDDGGVDEQVESGVETADTTDEDGAGGTPDATVVVADPAEVKTPPAAVVAVAETPEEAFAREHGLTPTKPGQRENRIPYSRVQKITENAVKKAVEPLQTRITSEFEPKLKQYEQKFSQIDQVERIMVDSPERFLEMLPTVNPKYAELLKKEAVQAATPAVSADMPQPDYDLGDGRRTYSQEGLMSLMKWQAAQTRAEVMGETQKLVGPLAEERAAAQRYNALTTQITNTVNHARQNWAGFGEIENDILAVLKTDTKISLHDAYIRVRNQKVQTQMDAAKADEAKVRAKVLKEIQAAPKATSVVPAASTSRPAETGGKKALEDVIKEAWNRSKK